MNLYIIAIGSSDITGSTNFWFTWTARMEPDSTKYTDSQRLIWVEVWKALANSDWHWLYFEWPLSQKASAKEDFLSLSFPWIHHDILHFSDYFDLSFDWLYILPVLNVRQDEFLFGQMSVPLVFNQRIISWKVPGNKKHRKLQGCNGGNSYNLSLSIPIVALNESNIVSLGIDPIAELELLDEPS